MISQTYFSGKRAMFFLASAIAFVLGLQAGQAKELSVQEIVDGLQVSKTRSLSTTVWPSPTPDDIAFVKRVRGQGRSLILDDREHMAAVVAKRPNVDLEVNFDYDSAALTPKSESQLNSLGKALTTPELMGSIFSIGGYADAKGSDLYNQPLSERRAEAVKRFLIENYHIPAANLITAGYGKTHLKNQIDPFAGENRRAQIANLAEAEQVAR